jgi:hypothetical protein
LRWHRKSGGAEAALVRRELFDRDDAPSLKGASFKPLVPTNRA